MPPMVSFVVVSMSANRGPAYFCTKGYLQRTNASGMFQVTYRCSGWCSDGSGAELKGGGRQQG